MTQWLKQSTAVTIKMGPFLDDTDGKTQKTALTISQADIRLSKNGGTLAQSNNSAGATHDANGIYGVPLDTTDTNTLGRLKVFIQESGALPVWQEFMVVPANVWDSMFGADRLQVHVDEMTNGIITAAAIATGAIDADAIATDAVQELYDGSPLFNGTATAGSSNTITLPVAASSTLNFFKGGFIVIKSGTGAGQPGRFITAYSTGRVATVNVDWAVTPDNTSVVSIYDGGFLGETAEAVFTRVFGATAGSFTFDQLVKLMAYVLLGKASGLNTTTATYRKLDDSADGVVATVDSSGNRSAVTRTP